MDSDAPHLEAYAVDGAAVGAGGTVPSTACSLCVCIVCRLSVYCGGECMCWLDMLLWDSRLQERRDMNGLARQPETMMQSNTCKAVLANYTKCIQGLQSTCFQIIEQTEQTASFLCVHHAKGCNQNQSGDGATTPYTHSTLVTLSGAASENGSACAL